jgi:hypothetical protein
LASIRVPAAECFGAAFTASLAQGSISRREDFPNTSNRVPYMGFREIVGPFGPFGIVAYAPTLSRTAVDEVIQ